VYSVGFEPPALFVLGWMNPGSLPLAGVCASDNLVSITHNACLTLNSWVYAAISSDRPSERRKSSAISPAHVELELKFGAYTQTQNFHVSKIIHAQLRFVYDWCTDYRESDPQITGSKSKRKILMKTKHRVVWVASYRSSGKIRNAVDVVTLQPPNAWHLDFIGDEADQTADYTLTPLGARKTRLAITVKVRYKVRNVPSKAQDVKELHEVWDKYVAALEKDYGRNRS